MYDNFKLRKLKLLSNLGVEAIYESRKQVGDETHWDLVDKTSPTNRHPDLGVTVKGLKIHVATIFSMLQVGLYKPLEDFNEDEITLMNELLNKITITGVAISGEINEETGKDSRGVVITATKEVLNNKTLVLNTPRIDFNNPAYEGVDKIIDICEAITKETYEYLFKRKYAQATLFDAEEAKDDDDSKSKEKDGVSLPDSDENVAKAANPKMENKLEEEKQKFRMEQVEKKKEEAQEKQKVSKNLAKKTKKRVTKADLKKAAEAAEADAIKEVA